MLLLGDWVESERDRWGLWCIVGLGGGVVGYFSLPTEPVPLLFLATFPTVLVPLFLAWRCHWGILYPLVILLTFVGGFHLAQFRTHQVAAPVLQEELSAVSLVAEVVSSEPVAGGVRLLLRPESIEGIESKRYPHFLRLVSRGEVPELEAGQRIEALASLAPPPPPAVPGDYDFSRVAYFQKIGAVGFTYGAPDLIGQRSAGAEQDSWRTPLEAWAQWWSDSRRRLADTTIARLPGQTGAVTAALLTGLRGAISEETNQAMRHSGLAHLLAISGLHLGLIAGAAFFALRALLCLWPAIALRLPTKKIAAASALVVAFCYLFLAGATIPTQRAFIMTSLVLIAVLLDRTALTLRLVALAALLVLVLSPESLLGASFQMSFAAVTGLVAGYEILREQRVFSDRGRNNQGHLSTAFHYLLGVALTTVIATVATAPFALYHFNALTSYGLFANLLAVPLTAFWVMPAALLVLLAYPFGLAMEVLPLMGKGVELVLLVAGYISSLPGARVLVPQMPAWGLAFCVTGGLWLCLWRSNWRFAGLPVFLAGLATPIAHNPPDILIEESMEVMAVAGPEDLLVLSNRRKARFSSDQWLERRAQNSSAVWPEKGSHYGEWLACDDLGCLYDRAGKRVAFPLTAQAMAEDCMPADLVITAKDPPIMCQQRKEEEKLVTRLDLWRNGGHAFWLRNDDIEQLTVRQWQGNRPWAAYRGRPE